MLPRTRLDEDKINHYVAYSDNQMSNFQFPTGNIDDMKINVDKFGTIKQVSHDGERLKFKSLHCLARSSSYLVEWRKTSIHGSIFLELWMGRLPENYKTCIAITIQYACQPKAWVLDTDMSRSTQWIENKVKKSISPGKQG